MTDACRQYLALRKQIEALADRGEGDSPEADDLRDQMEPLWHNMTRQEREVALKAKGRVR